jgi:hypothetical protein
MAGHLGGPAISHFSARRRSSCGGEVAGQQVREVDRRHPMSACPARLRPADYRAADVLIADHGSVSTYAASVGIPLLLSHFPEDEVDPTRHRAFLWIPKIYWSVLLPKLHWQCGVRGSNLLSSLLSKPI